MRLSILFFFFLGTMAPTFATATSLFLEPPRERHMEESPNYQRNATAAYSVKLNIRGLAENGLLQGARKEPLRIDLPQQGIESIHRHFKPVKGFTFDKEGNVHVDGLHSKRNAGRAGWALGSIW